MVTSSIFHLAGVFFAVSLSLLVVGLPLPSDAQNSQRSWEGRSSRHCPVARQYPRGEQKIACQSGNVSFHSRPRSSLYERETGANLDIHRVGLSTWYCHFFLVPGRLTIIGSGRLTTMRVQKPGHVRSKTSSTFVKNSHTTVVTMRGVPILRPLTVCTGTLRFSKSTMAVIIFGSPLTFAHGSLLGWPPRLHLIRDFKARSEHLNSVIRSPL